MSLNFNKLFTVKVAHSYYSTGESKEDVIFVPSRECRTLLDNNRMLFRNNVNGGISLLYRVMPDNTTPFIPLGQQTYIFGLSLKNKARFLNTTDLTDPSGKKFGSGIIPYFMNDGTSVLKYELLDLLAPAVFTYQFSFSPPIIGSTSGTLDILDESGQSVHQVANIHSDIDGIFSVPLDLSSLPKGKYTFRTGNGANSSLKDEKVYIDSDLARKDIFGILEITNDGNAVIDPYSMQFERQQTFWSYFVVMKSGNITDTSSIQIEDTANEDIGSPYGQYSFIDIEEPVYVNGIKAVKLTSSNPVPFYEKPKMGLELTAGLTPLLKDLPNPRSGGTIAGFKLVGSDHIPVSEVYIYV